MIYVSSFVPAATFPVFSEAAYLRANPDVARALDAGVLKSAKEHFEAIGRRENRLTENEAAINDLRAKKLTKLGPVLDLTATHRWAGDKVDFLTDAIRAETKIVHTDNISSNSYDGQVLELIKRLPDGLILDAGAGLRDVYFENVVNFEIKDYLTTDVLGVGEHLPFKDASFDAVISIAVLEHVRDPFRCASEIVRVLKPGGRLICAVPFLQPLHGYPHHYYNMTHQGVRALFEDRLTIEKQEISRVMEPIFALSWFVQRYADNLPPAIREKFLSLKMSDIAGKADAFDDNPIVLKLSNEGRFELACATYLFASKP